jgi:hypothetical protein
MPVHGTSSEVGISRDHIEPDGILLNSLQVYAPSFCIHVNQAIPHNDLRPNHFQWSAAHTCPCQLQLHWHVHWS